MAKKKTHERPPEIPRPSKPEIIPDNTPEEPELPNEPEITPDNDPDEPASPPELPETK